MPFFVFGIRLVVFSIDFFPVQPFVLDGCFAFCSIRYQECVRGTNAGDKLPETPKLWCWCSLETETKLKKNILPKNSRLVLEDFMGYPYDYRAVYWCWNSTVEKLCVWCLSPAPLFSSVCIWLRSVGTAHMIHLAWGWTYAFVTLTCYELCLPDNNTAGENIKIWFKWKTHKIIKHLQ